MTLVTDGKTQSAQFDEHYYHESLVHPAMLKAIASAGNSIIKHVFIGGGGELATAREVLRYASVEKVIMVDIDEVVIQVCTQYLPEWGGNDVLNNPRFELIIGDAYKYLMEITEQTFDVIIMDISDPIEAGPGPMLYTKEFYEHVKTLLKQPHGVFVTQSGSAESVPAAVVDVSDHIDPSCFAPIYNTLNVVFDCVIPYSTSMPSFVGDWGYNLAFQISSDTKYGLDDDKWDTPKKGLIDNLIEKHITGGSDILKWYDETTHKRMFSLSKPLRKYTEKDKRIITRDNPVFMY